MFWQSLELRSLLYNGSKQWPNLNLKVWTTSNEWKEGDWTKSGRSGSQSSRRKILSISIDICMFFSSFEVIVLILGGKVMTFVLYPPTQVPGNCKKLEYDRIICVWMCYCVTNGKLELGCLNGTKYPLRQPIPNRAILPNRARVYRRTDGQGDSSIPPLTSLRGV